MKLRTIAENSKPISTGARYFEDFISYMKENKEKYPQEWDQLDTYLSNPVTKLWQVTKHIITDVVKKSQQDRTLGERPRTWLMLHKMDDNIANASLFAIDPKVADGTNFSKLATNKSDTKKTMELMGPGGYLTAYSGPTTVNPSQLRRDMRARKLNATRLKSSLSRMQPAGYKPFRPF